MADFKTHLSVGSAVAFLLATFAYIWQWLNNFLMAILVFFIGTAASFLPDMDSDSGVPVKIIFSLYGYLAAGWIIYYSTLSHYSLFLTLFAAAFSFGIIYYFGSAVFRRITQHRGIFHSIPAAIIAFFVVFLLLDYTALQIKAKFTIALAVFVGYITHLVLDEIFALKFISDREAKIHIKKKRSFGTALDLGFSKAQPLLLGFIAWAIVVLLIFLAIPLIQKIYLAFS